MRNTQHAPKGGLRGGLVEPLKRQEEEAAWKWRNVGRVRREPRCEVRVLCARLTIPTARVGAKAEVLCECTGGGLELEES